jgi:hypothetical protein
MALEGPEYDSRGIYWGKRKIPNWMIGVAIVLIAVLGFFCAGGMPDNFP